MTELNDRCLDTFPRWLGELGGDAKQLGELLAAGTDAPPIVREYITGGLNYLFKSLDLIPDGIEDLGFLDDAFVLRVSSRLALTEAPQLRDAQPILGRLADDADLIAELLGDDFARLEAYVKTLRTASARGRSVEEILGDDVARSAFLSELSGWAASYAAPSFARDEKNLVKLTSFLSAKLPS